MLAVFGLGAWQDVASAWVNNPLSSLLRSHPSNEKFLIVKENKHL